MQDILASLDWADPTTRLAAGALGVVLVLLVLVLRAVSRPARVPDALVHQLGRLDQTVQALGQGQELSGQECGVVRSLTGNATQYFNMVAPGHTRHRLQSLELKDQSMLVQSLAQLFHLLVCAGIAGGIR